MGTIYGRQSCIRFSLASDVRCVMRLLLPLVALCALASAPLRADMFHITLTGNPGSPSGSGTFSTDGTCTLCTTWFRFVEFHCQYRSQQRNRRL